MGAGGRTDKIGPWVEGDATRGPGAFRVLDAGGAAVGQRRIGQGPEVLGRLELGRMHRQAQARVPGHSQGEVFAGSLECSYVLDGAWHAHQRLGLENDLIAAYVLATGAVPPGQFIG